MPLCKWGSNFIGHFVVNKKKKRVTHFRKLQLFTVHIQSLGNQGEQPSIFCDVIREVIDNFLVLFIETGIS